MPSSYLSLNPWARSFAKDLAIGPWPAPSEGLGDRWRAAEGRGSLNSQPALFLTARHTIKE